MLSLQMTSGDYITVGDNIIIQVFHDSGDHFQISIDAPREIDQRVRDVSKLIGYALNLALHDGLTVEDVDLLVN